MDTAQVYTLSQEIFLHKLAAKKGCRLYQWPSGSFCLVSRKTGEFCGTGVNMSLDEVADFLVCIPASQADRD
jgi:hypothetical protein